MTNLISIEQEIASQNTRGVLLVLTGPSGAGKDTMLEALTKTNPEMITITTTTTREKRVGESEGHPYYFISRSTFEQLVADGAFFEWVEFRGELYGTQKKTLTEALDSGADVLWKIEAKGIKNIKQRIKEMIPRSAFVYLVAPTIDMMKHRVIKAEGKNAQKRWNEPLVVWEMKQYEDCEFLVVNVDDNLADAIKKIEAILLSKRQEIQR